MFLQSNLPSGIEHGQIRRCCGPRGVVKSPWLAVFGCLYRASAKSEPIK